MTHFRVASRLIETYVKLTCFRRFFVSAVSFCTLSVGVYVLRGWQVANAARLLHPGHARFAEPASARVAVATAWCTAAAAVQVLVRRCCSMSELQLVPTQVWQLGTAYSEVRAKKETCDDASDAFRLHLCEDVRKCSGAIN